MPAARWLHRCAWWIIAFLVGVQTASAQMTLQQYHQQTGIGVPRAPSYAPLIQGATIQQQQIAAQAWSNSDPQVVMCLQNSYHLDIQQLVAKGIQPGDPRIAPYALNCANMFAAKLQRQQSAQPEPARQSSATSVAAASSQEAMPAASFDCSQAQRVDEKLICSDRALRALDAELGQKYGEYLNGLSEDRRGEAISTERYWVTERDAVCGISNTTRVNSANQAVYVACLKEQVQNRIQELAGSTGGSALNATGSVPDTHDGQWKQCLGGEPDEATISACTAIIQSGQETASNRAAAFYDRGNAYYRQSEYDRAISDYDEAIRLKPDYAGAFTNRGGAHYQKGEYDRALTDLNEAIRINPDVAQTFNDRGLVYERTRQLEAAAKDFDRAISLNPQYKAAYNNKEQVEALLEAQTTGATDSDTGSESSQASANNQGVENQYAEAGSNSGLSVSRPTSIGERAQNSSVSALHGTLQMLGPITYVGVMAAVGIWVAIRGRRVPKDQVRSPVGVQSATASAAPLKTADLVVATADAPEVSGDRFAEYGAGATIKRDNDPLAEYGSKRDNGSGQFHSLGNEGSSGGDSAASSEQAEPDPKLIPCGACATLLSPNAETCPSCGEPNKWTHPAIVKYLASNYVPKEGLFVKARGYNLRMTVTYLTNAAQVGWLILLAGVVCEVIGAVFGFALIGLGLLLMLVGGLMTGFGLGGHRVQTFEVDLATDPPTHKCSDPTYWAETIRFFTA